MKGETIYKAFIAVFTLSVLVLGKQLIDQDELLYNILGSVFYLIGALLGIMLIGNRRPLY